MIVAPAAIKTTPSTLSGRRLSRLRHQYQHSDNARVVPWILSSIKPIQLSNFDFDGYVASRRKFTTDEWIDLLISRSDSTRNYSADVPNLSNSSA